jgi:hypothetical protein
MDERATFLVPDRGLDSWSYPLIVEVLDGMPSSVWALFQGVVDDVGPDDGRLEDPAVGKVPAQSCAKDTSEHVRYLLFEIRQLNWVVGFETVRNVSFSYSRCKRRAIRKRLKGQKKKGPKVLVNFVKLAKIAISPVLGKA